MDVSRLIAVLVPNDAAPSDAEHGPAPEMAFQTLLQLFRGAPSLSAREQASPDGLRNDEENAAATVPQDESSLQESERDAARRPALANDPFSPAGAMAAGDLVLLEVSPDATALQQVAAPASADAPERLDTLPSQASATIGSRPHIDVDGRSELAIADVALQPRSESTLRSETAGDAGPPVRPAKEQGSAANAPDSPVNPTILFPEGELDAESRQTNTDPTPESLGSATASDAPESARSDGASALRTMHGNESTPAANRTSGTASVEQASPPRPQHSPIEPDAELQPGRGAPRSARITSFRTTVDSEGTSGGRDGGDSGSSSRVEVHTSQEAWAPERDSKLHKPGRATESVAADRPPYATRDAERSASHDAVAPRNATHTPAAFEQISVTVERAPMSEAAREVLSRIFGIERGRVPVLAPIEARNATSDPASEGDRELAAAEQRPGRQPGQQAANLSHFQPVPESPVARDAAPIVHSSQVRAEVAPPETSAEALQTDVAEQIATPGDSSRARSPFAPQPFASTAGQRTDAWLDALLRQPASVKHQRDGTSILRLSIDERSGSMTLRTRRDGERMLISIGFSDAGLHAAAQEEAGNIRTALQHLFDVAVDLSFAQHDQSGDREKPPELAPRGMPRDTTRTSASADETDAVSRPARRSVFSARHEWIG